MLLISSGVLRTLICLNLRKLQLFIVQTLPRLLATICHLVVVVVGSGR